MSDGPGTPIDLEEVLQEIRARGARTVGLQYPDGLRLHAIEAAEELETRGGVTTMVSAEPTFGACDVPRMPVDLIVQVGHAPMPYLNLKNVLFVEAPMPSPSTEFLAEALPLLGTRVGLLTTVQHRPWLGEVRGYLEKHGKEVLVGEADGRVAYPGQLLGCDVHPAREVADRVDAFLYVGTGDFHPLGVALALEKPVIAADPFREEVRDMEAVKERILRQRYAAIALAQDAMTFGIIVSRKIGQHRMALGMQIRERLAAAARRGYLLLMDFVGPDFLQGYQVDAFVNTACPRIAIDDASLYDRPMLTPPELEVVLGDRDGSAYVLDEITADHKLR